MHLPIRTVSMVAKLIDNYRVTHLHMVPTMFVRLLKLPKEVRKKYDISSLKFVVHAAAPCPIDVKREMIEWWGPVINEYYGATETGAVAFCSSDEWLAHLGTVGRPQRLAIYALALARSFMRPYMAAIVVASGFSGWPTCFPKSRNANR